MLLMWTHTNHAIWALQQHDTGDRCTWQQRASSTGGRSGAFARCCCAVRRPRAAAAASDSALTLAEIHAASEAKSFDYRVLTTLFTL